MSDLQPLTDAQASEHVFWQYRTHRRRWRRLTGKPVRRFRRHVRYFVKRRGKGKGQRHGFGFGGRRRSYVVTQDGIRAYLGARGKGGARGSGRGHGRKRNPRGRDGTVMTCRICNSEELVGAKCTQGQGRGAGAAQPPAFPAFHALASMSESRRVAGQLTWQGVGGDDSVDVPLAPSLQELTTAGEDHIFMAESAEGTAVQTDHLEADPWAHRRRPPSRERPAQSSASSWGSWVPIQLQTALSMGRRHQRRWTQPQTVLLSGHHPPVSGAENQQSERIYRKL